MASFLCSPPPPPPPPIPTPERANASRQYLTYNKEHVSCFHNGIFIPHLTLHSTACCILHIPQFNAPSYIQPKDGVAAEYPARLRPFLKNVASGSKDSRLSAQRRGQRGTCCYCIVFSMDLFHHVMQNCDFLCFSLKQKFISMN